MGYLARKVLFTALLLIVLVVLCMFNVMVFVPDLAAKFQYKVVASLPDLRNAIETVDATINEDFIGRMHFVELFSRIQNALGRKEFWDFLYVKDGDGYLHETSFYKGGDDRMIEYAMRLKVLQNRSIAKGAKMIFVLAPSKYKSGYTNNVDNLPIANPEADISQLMFYLNRFKVNSIDFNRVFPNDTLRYDQCFFKTEKYWTIPAALMASQQLLAWMNQSGHVDLDPDGLYLSNEAFDWITYPGTMVGTMGQKTGVPYSGTEDFTALWPAQTRVYEYLRYLENGERTVAKGTTYEILLDRSYVEKRTSLYGESPYAAYHKGQFAHEIITNTELPKGPNVLMIRDSYFNPVVAFLAPVCHTIDSIWSANEETIYNFEDYFHTHKYDYVIMELDPYNISDQAFDFYRKEAGTMLASADKERE